MKTVGIIGGAGFIGSHITKKFLADGYRVIVYDSALAQDGLGAYFRPTRGTLQANKG